MDVVYVGFAGAKTDRIHFQVNVLQKNGGRRGQSHAS